MRLRNLAIPALVVATSLGWALAWHAVESGRWPPRTRQPQPPQPTPVPRTERENYRDLIEDIARQAKASPSKNREALLERLGGVPGRGRDELPVRFSDPTLEAGRWLLRALIHGVPETNAPLVAAVRTPTPRQLEKAREMEGSLRKAFELRETLGDRPTAELGGFVNPPSGYPPGVRDRARDTISYLLASYLARLGSPTPQRSAGAPLPERALVVDVRDLLEHPCNAEVALDPSRPPVERASAVLDDLESWHQAQGRLEAALEARLERVRLFCEGSPSIRSALKADLLRRLPSFRGVPWYSMGIAEAALLCEGSDPSALEEARKLADEGRRAHPGSLGSRHCEAIGRVVDAILGDPEVSLALSGDGDAAVLQVRQRLPARLELIALRPAFGSPASYAPWKIGPRYQWSYQPGRFPELGEADLLRAWSLSVPGADSRLVPPPSSPYAPHQQARAPLDAPYRASELRLGSLPRGAHIFARLSPGGPPQGLNGDAGGIRVAAVDGRKSRLALVVDAETGAGVAGAEVWASRPDPKRPGHEIRSPVGETGRDGCLWLPASSQAVSSLRARHRGYEVSASIQASFPRAGERRFSASLALSRYRAEPGETVPFILILRHGSAWEAGGPAAGVELTVRLDRWNARLTTDEYGIAAGALTVPPSGTAPTAPLSLSVSSTAGSVELATALPLLVVSPGRPQGSAAHLTVAPSAVFPAQRLTFEGRLSRAQRGVRGARVSWSLRRREPEVKPTPCPDFSFCMPRKAKGLVELAAGEVRTDRDGRFTIEVGEKGRTWDTPGFLVVESCGPQSPCRGAVSLEPAWKAPSVYLDSDIPQVALAPFEASVHRTVGGIPRAGFSRLTLRREVNGTAGEEVFRVELRHDESGVARFRSPALPAGGYLAEVETGGGRVAFAASPHRRVLVVADGYEPPRLTLAVADRPPGRQTANVFVGHGAKRPVFAIVASPDGGLRLERLEGPGGRVLTIPTGSIVHAYTLRDGQLENTSILARPRGDALEVRLARAVARPTGTEPLEVRISHEDGKPAREVGVLAVVAAAAENEFGFPWAYASISFPAIRQVPPERNAFTDLLPRESSGWNATGLPELAAERVPLLEPQDHYPTSCVYIPPPPRRPELTRRRRGGPVARAPDAYSEQESLMYSMLAQARTNCPERQEPPALFRADLRTDADGLVRIPLPRRPARPAILHVAAIGRDGSVSYLREPIGPAQDRGRE